MKPYDEWTEEEHESAFDAIINEIKNYRATGLTPEQINDLAKHNVELQEENDRLKAQLDAAIEWADQLCKTMLEYNCDGYVEPESWAEDYKEWRKTNNDKKHNAE